MKRSGTLTTYIEYANYQKNESVVSDLSSLGVEGRTNLPAVFFSPREDTPFTVSAAHEQFNVLAVHPPRAHTILEYIHFFEIYTVFM
jgi:hypothetical protein